MTAKEDKIREIVESVLATRFEDVQIVSVEVRSDEDDAGNEIAFINVVFDGNIKQLDSEKTTGLVRRIRPRLENAGEMAFPVLSFIAKSELRKLKPEAA